MQRIIIALAIVMLSSNELRCADLLPTLSIVIPPESEHAVEVDYADQQENIYFSWAQLSFAAKMVAASGCVSGAILTFFDQMPAARMALIGASVGLSVAIAVDYKITCNQEHKALRDGRRMVNYVMRADDHGYRDQEYVLRSITSSPMQSVVEQ